jgi:hypothetical protein
MARPIVLVFQEFAQVTITPDIPDLNCLLVGPAYHIQDYLDDKSDIQAASDYGTKEDDNPYLPPAAATDAITIADPPNNTTGAVLDATSVKVFFDEARVEISKDATTGATVVANSNVVTGAGGTTFLTDGVKAGDYIIIQDPAAPGTNPDLVKKVLAVDSETVLRTTTNFDAANTCLYRVEREVDDVEIASSFVVVTGNQIVIQGGVTTILTGESAARTINYAKVYVQYRSLRQDLKATIDTVTTSTEITTKIGRIDSRNPLAGAAFLALQNTTTEVQFYGVSVDSLLGHTECQDLIEARNDIYAIVPLTETLGIITSWKSNVEQLASVTLAQTTGVPQKFRVVIGAQDIPEEKLVSGAYSGAGAHLSVDGAIAGTPIASADPINIFADANATFVTAGVRAGDTLVIVDDTAGTPRLGSYTISEVYDENRLRTSTAFPVADNSGTVIYYIIRGTGTPETTLPGSFAAGSATATATVDTGLDRLAGVADEYQGKVVRLVDGVSAASIGDYLILNSTAANPAILTVEPDVATNADVDGSIWNTLVSVTTGRVIATRRPFRRIRDNSATFITDLVIATDNLQVPNPLTGVDYTTNTPYEYAVAYIPSENEVILDTNEDVIAQDPEAGDTDLNFRINRDLTKDDQVDELVAISASVNSRRVVLVWPNEVEVTDLPDGSKTRAVASTPEDADVQPGYYLAAVVGALTAGLPSHQGFSNLGIAGVDKINNSSRYFSDSQLTELSDGGWFVFAQATESSAPYCIHQLTTDPDTLESGEYSLVKNFDFIALFFQDILDDFLGEYNINEETLGFLNQALETGIDVLKLRRFAKIGAPINNASVTSLEESSSSADTVEIYMDVDMPKPLNTIELHLVSQ